MKCQNCETTKHKKLYPDPCDPPIDTEDCLCKECRGNFLYDSIDEAERVVADLQELYKAEGHGAWKMDDIQRGKRAKVPV